MRAFVFINARRQILTASEFLEKYGEHCRFCAEEDDKHTEDKTVRTKTYYFLRGKKDKQSISKIEYKEILPVVLVENSFGSSAQVFMEADSLSEELNRIETAKIRAQIYIVPRNKVTKATNIPLC
jgi:hypothetical protein